MLWRDLRKAFPTWKPSSVAELPQFCKDKRDRFPPQRCKLLWLPLIANAWLQLLLPWVAQPVTRFTVSHRAMQVWIFPLIINTFIYRLHFVFKCVILSNIQIRLIWNIKVWQTQKCSLFVLNKTSVYYKHSSLYLAGVHASFEDSSTQHVVGHRVCQETLAHCAVDDPDCCLLQYGRPGTW